MSDSSKYWLNIDKPNKTATLHTVTCRYAIGKHETRYKGISFLKRDGAWFGFDTPAKAEQYANKQHSGYTFKRCARCL